MREGKKKKKTPLLALRQSKKYTNPKKKNTIMKICILAKKYEDNYIINVRSIALDIIN